MDWIPIHTKDELVFYWNWSCEASLFFFDVSNDEDLREAFNCKSTLSFVRDVHHQKCVKFDFLDYQSIKAYQFMKINDPEG